MKQLKLRAFDKIKNSQYDVLQIDFHGQKIQISNGEWLRNENNGDGIMVTNGERFVLMQSLGLKDRNGIEIFEGDLINYSGYIHLVIWNVYGWALQCLKSIENDTNNEKYEDGGECLKQQYGKFENLFNIFHIDSFIIVGNIYEDQDLIN